jgi:hypothetical protein
LSLEIHCLPWSIIFTPQQQEDSSVVLVGRIPHPAPLRSLHSVLRASRLVELRPRRTRYARSRAPPPVSPRPAASRLSLSPTFRGLRPAPFRRRGEGGESSPLRPLFILLWRYTSWLLIKTIRSISINTIR